MADPLAHSTPPEAAWLQIVGPELLGAYHANVASRPSEEWMQGAEILAETPRASALRIWPLASIASAVEPGHLLAFGVSDSADEIRFSGVGTIHRVLRGNDLLRVPGVGTDVGAVLLLYPFADWVASYQTTDDLWSLVDTHERALQLVDDSRVVDLLWLRQFLYGDESCRGQFVRHFSGYFGWLARKQGVPDSRLEDALQEVWLKLLQSDFMALRRFEGRARLKTYLTVVAKNAITDFVRRSRPDFEELEVDASMGESHDAPDSLIHERRLMGLACRRLPLRQRRILFLKYYVGFSAREIAERLKTSGNAVDVAAHDARKRLAKAVEEVTSGTQEAI